MNNVDITSVQHLIDVRNQLDRYASPDVVDWHLACINNRWTKRALASAGFGFLSPEIDAPVIERWKPIFSVAAIGGHSSAAAAAEYMENENKSRNRSTRDIEEGQGNISARADRKDTITANPDTASSTSGSDLGGTLSTSKAYKTGVTSKVVAVHGLNRPLFHIDLTSALQSAIANVEMRGEGGIAKGVGTKLS